MPFKNIWVIVRKQNFNQNFNLIVDARPTIANLLAKIFRWKIQLKIKILRENYTKYSGLIIKSRFSLLQQ